MTLINLLLHLFITQAHQNCAADNHPRQLRVKELKVLSVAVCFLWTTTFPIKSIALCCHLSPLLHSGFTVALPQFNTSH